MSIEEINEAIESVQEEIESLKNNISDLLARIDGISEEVPVLVGFFEEVYDRLIDASDFIEEAYDFFSIDFEEFI